MYCKNCNSLIEEGTTVCSNCGKSVYSYRTRVCPNCGYPENYKQIKRIKPKLLDWAILVLFFPLSLFYIPAIFIIRVNYLNKCTHCGYIENSSLPKK